MRAKKYLALLFLGVAAVWDGTPLCYAAQLGDVPLIRELYQHGADLEVCDDQGHTPLLIAAREGRAEAVEVFIELGAKQDYRIIKDYGITKSDRNFSAKDALEKGKNQYAWHIRFFVTQYEKMVAGREVNYDKTEQVLGKNGQ